MTEKERRTKIVCTIGPASKHLIRELEKAGMDIARINTAYTNETKIDFEHIMVDVRHWKKIPELELPEKGMIAVSFVKSHECVRNARDHASWLPICAKIETKEAVKNLDRIVKESDYVMVARGDLGKEFGIHLVPVVQEKIIETCKKYEKPFIVATEVLRSMINFYEPSRAESIDVFNTVKSGAYAIMLADETAVGKYPVESARWLDKLIRAVESFLENGGHECLLTTTPLSF